MLGIASPAVQKDGATNAVPDTAARNNGRRPSPGGTPKQGAKVCATCKGHGTLQCTRCKVVHYCSGECQRRDWQQHKQQCQKRGDAETLPTQPSPAGDESADHTVGGGAATRQAGSHGRGRAAADSGNAAGGKSLLEEIGEGFRMHEALYLPRAVGNGEDCYICREPSSNAAGGVLPLGCSCHGRLAHAHFECQHQRAMQAEQSAVQTDGYTAATTVLTCASCQDAFGGAMLIGLLEKTAALAPATIPEHHPYKANLDLKLAIALYNVGTGAGGAAAGLTAEAEMILRCSAQVLSARGPEREIQLMRVLGPLGQMQLAHSKYPDAIQSFEAFLRLQRRLCHKSSSSCQTHVHLAEALLLDGQLGEAERRCCEVLSKIRRKANEVERDSKHESVLALLCHAEAVLAAIYTKQGRSEKTVHVFEKSVTRLQKLRGPEASETLESQVTLSKALFDDGQLDAAEELICATLESVVRGHEDNRQMRDTANELLAHIWKQRKYEAAEEVMLEQLDQIERTAGFESAAMVIKGNLGCTYFESRRYAEAEEIFRDVLHTMQESDVESGLINTIEFNLVVTLQKQDQIEAAVEAAELALMRRRMVYGEESEHTWRAHVMVGDAYGLIAGCCTPADEAEQTPTQVDAYEKAREHLALALTNQARVLGDDHPDTMRSKLALVLLGEGCSCTAETNQAEEEEDKGEDDDAEMAKVELAVKDAKAADAAARLLAEEAAEAAAKARKRTKKKEGKAKAKAKKKAAARVKAAQEEKKRQCAAEQEVQTVQKVVDAVIADTIATAVTEAAAAAVKDTKAAATAAAAACLLAEEAKDATAKERKRAKKKEGKAKAKAKKEVEAAQEQNERRRAAKQGAAVTATVHAAEEASIEAAIGDTITAAERAAVALADGPAATLPAEDGSTVQEDAHGGAARDGRSSEAGIHEPDQLEHLEQEHVQQEQQDGPKEQHDQHQDRKEQAAESDSIVYQQPWQGQQVAEPAAVECNQQQQHQQELLFDPQHLYAWRWQQFCSLPYDMQQEVVQWQQQQPQYYHQYQEQQQHYPQPPPNPYAAGPVVEASPIR